MRIEPIPYFLNRERTPLVDQLIDLIKQRDDYIRDLENEVNRLKKLPVKPTFDKQRNTERKEKTAQEKRPGSQKAKKTSGLPVHEIHILKVENKPASAKFKGYRNFLVQDISIELKNRLYRCERWQRLDGSYIQARLPEEYKGHHFGPHLRSYILHQVYHQGVTRNLLLQQLREWGIHISEGQINNILIKDKEDYHAEKASIFEAGFFASSYLQADDTGARHCGKNGYCTYIGNEYFAFFESSYSKNRLNYLSCLRKALPETFGLQLDEIALEYLRKMPQVMLKLINILSHIEMEPQFFNNETELSVYLKRYGIISPKEICLCTEAALFSPLKRFLFNNKEILFLTDEAGQFRLPSIKHALCWLHIERKFKQLLPHTKEQSDHISEKQEMLWLLYRDLKRYQFNPSVEQKGRIRTQFKELCTPIANEKSLNEVLDRIKRWEEKLLLVLDYPFIPLHNNTSERDIREMVRRRKVSGGTRHDLGRQCRDTFASLKKTCQKVGITFWDYLIDRTFHRHQIKLIAEYVRARAAKNQFDVTSRREV